MADEKFKVWWDEQNGIVRYEHLADVQMSEELAQAIAQALQNIFEKHPQVGLLVNTIRAKSIPGSKARKALSELVRSLPNIKIAIVNSSIAIRVTLNFVLQMGGHTDHKVFPTEAEALAWLKEGK